MFLKGLVLMLSLLTPAATWAQVALKLTREQASVVKPLLDSRLKETATVKKKFGDGDQSEAAKDTANESLKAISSKYDSRITSTLNPDQLKKWNDLSKGWNAVM